MTPTTKSREACSYLRRYFSFGVKLPDDVDDGFLGATERFGDFFSSSDDDPPLDLDGDLPGLAMVTGPISFHS